MVLPPTRGFWGSCPFRGGCALNPGCSGISTRHPVPSVSPHPGIGVLSNPGAVEAPHDIRVPVVSPLGGVSALRLSRPGGSQCPRPRAQSEFPGLPGWGVTPLPGKGSALDPWYGGSFPHTRSRGYSPLPGGILPKTLVHGGLASPKEGVPSSPGAVGEAPDTG